MNWNLWIRQAHRWLSIAFTLTVLVNIAVLVWAEPIEWVYFLPLPPLGLLLLSGLYLFVLPYAMRWRGGRRVGGSE